MGRLTEKTIDIDDILKDKMGDKAKFVPDVLVSWLKRIVHQKEVNDFLWKNREKQGVEWLDACVRYLDMTLEVNGRENLPDKADDGRFRYLVNDLLMNLSGLAPLCIPINKTGLQSRSFPAMVEAGFHSENHILMFPAGLCSRKQGSRIHDLPWRKTFITKSIETHRDVIPIHFGGQNSPFFYRLANICKALHIKFNIAMLFLVDEMYKNVHKTFRVSIGKPISWKTFDKTKTPMEWAKIVEDKVYELE